MLNLAKSSAGTEEDAMILNGPGGSLCCVTTRLKWRKEIQTECIIYARCRTCTFASFLKSVNTRMTHHWYLMLIGSHPTEHILLDGIGKVWICPKVFCELRNWMWYLVLRIMGVIGIYTDKFCARLSIRDTCTACRQMKLNKNRTPEIVMVPLSNRKFVWQNLVLSWIL